MSAISCLSVREENEICEAIAEVVPNQIPATLIRRTLKEWVLLHGNAHTDDVIVESVSSILQDS